MSFAEEFLCQVLPSQGKGRYCLATFHPNRRVVKHSWAESIAQLVQQADRDDETADAVYHACAVYGEQVNEKGKRTRSASNVTYLRSLYAEVDIRDQNKLDKRGNKPTNGYETADEAGEALDAFLATTKLPCPLIVHSGGGFHFYWPLTEDITKEKWQPYANGLKKLAEKHGFRIDPPITVDSARILRTPGTTNRKYPDTVVKILDTSTYYSGPYLLSDFRLLLVQDTKPVAQSFEKSPTDGELIATKCNQLKRLRDNPEAQTGREWVGCGRLLAECTDGRILWEKWSSKDARYDTVEADKKWAESLKHGKGVTCGYFEEINPTGCRGCPFRGRIKTPLILGRAQKSSLPETVSSILDTIEIPRGYKFDDMGKLLFVHDKQNGEGDVEEKVYKVTEFPVIVTHAMDSELSTNEFGIGMAYWLPHTGWRDINVKAADFFRNTEVALASSGIIAHDDKFLKQYVKQCLTALDQKQGRTVSYDSFGWKEDDTKFLLGDRLISATIDASGDVTTQIAKVSLTNTAARIAKAMVPKGTLDDAMKAGQQLLAPGHEWQFATYASSYAAIIMNFLIPQEGGVVWSTYDHEGGKGKSLATLAAASVWGIPEEISVTSSDTAVARNIKLGTLRHIPQCYDEMNRSDPQAAKDYLQAFTSGKEKDRGTREGQLQTTNRNWRTVLITSSNQELKGAVAASDGSQAMSSRVMEIEATTLPIAKREHKESFKKQFLANSGQMGEAFVIRTVACKAIGALAMLIDEGMEYIEGRYEFGPQQRFKLAFFVAHYVAYRIMVETGLLEFNPEERIDWLLEKNNFNEVHGSVEVVSMEDLIASYMNENMRSMLVVRSDNGYKAQEPLTNPTGPLTIRREQLGNLYLDRGPLGKWLTKREVSMTAFLESLAKKGLVLHKSKHKNLGAGTPYSTTQTRCLVINGSRLALIEAEDNVIDLEQAKAIRG